MPACVTDRVLLLVVAVSVVAWMSDGGVHAARQPRQLTAEQVSRKIRVLERKLQGLSKQMERVDSAKGRFSDDPPCPDEAPLFFHAPQLNSCYHLEASSVLLNWTEADILCKSLHSKSNLVAIETEAENNHLRAKWKSELGIATIARFWTSGRMVNNNWRWMATNRRFAFDNWIPTTTHDDERFQCLAIYSNEGYYWGDVACWGPHQVTCEIML